MMANPVGSNRFVVCDANVIRDFWEFFLGLWSAWTPPLILGVMIIVLAFSKSARVWVKEGARNVTSRWSLLGVLVFEAMLLIVTFAPYFAFGNVDEKVGYATFALPCLAALVGGGGLIFDQRNRLDKNGWSYFLSAMILFVAFLVFVWRVWFFHVILFLFAPTLAVAASVGLLAYCIAGQVWVTCRNFFAVVFCACGLTIGLLGFEYYGIFVQSCPLS